MKLELSMPSVFDIFSPENKLGIRKQFETALLFTALFEGKISIQQVNERLEKLNQMTPKPKRR